MSLLLKDIILNSQEFSSPLVMKFFFSSLNGFKKSDQIIIILMFYDSLGCLSLWGKLLIIIKHIYLFF